MPTWTCETVAGRTAGIHGGQRLDGQAGTDQDGTLVQAVKLRSAQRSLGGESPQQERRAVLHVDSRTPRGMAHGRLERRPGEHEGSAYCPGPGHVLRVSKVLKNYLRRGLRGAWRN